MYEQTHLIELYWLQSEIATKIARCRTIVAEMPNLTNLEVHTPLQRSLELEERRCQKTERRVKKERVFLWRRIVNRRKKTDEYQRNDTR